MNVTIGLCTGHILTSFPYQNQYLVSTENGTIPASALETGSGRRGGHRGGGVYMPGTRVLVAVWDRKSSVFRSNGFPNLILGAFDPFTIFEGTDFQPHAVIPDTHADAVTNTVYDKLAAAERTPILNENRGHKRPIDMLPGDWFKSSTLGGILMLSEFLAKIGIDPHACLTFHGIDHLVELISANFSEDHGDVFRELVHRGIAVVDIQRFALTLGESMGGTPAFKAGEETGKLGLQDDKQSGFFRREEFRGGAVEGSWDAYKTAVPPPQPFVFGENNYPGMLSVMQRMDGIYRLRAAKEIKFEKTASIVIPVQKADLRTAVAPGDPPDADDRSDVIIKQEALSLKSTDEVYALMPILHDQFATVEEEQLFFRGLRQDSGIWFFPKREDIEKALFGDQADKQLPVLKPDAQEYTEDDLIKADVEVYPGRRIRLFKNSSVFLMSEDGGFVIGDGYGGEIRMNRGNVTISAAADIRVLPGRDLTEQIPGNRISRVGDRVEISSTRGAVALKAQTNFQVVSGGAEGGILSLENRSPLRSAAEITEEQLKKGQPFGSGIVLKSLISGTTILGSYLYAAGYAPGKDSKAGVDDRRQRCDIVLDGGIGSLLLSGDNAVMAFQTSAALTMLDRATGIYLQSDSLIEIASNIGVVTSQMMVDRGFGQVPRPRLLPTKVDVSRHDNLPAAVPQFVVQGSIMAKNSVLAGEHVQAKGGVSANQGCNPDPLVAPYNVNFTIPDSQGKSYQVVAQATATVAEALLQGMVSYGVATEYGQHITEFAFPDSDSPAYRAKDYQLVAPRWYAVLTDDAQTWSENALAHAILGSTYPYPGKEAFAKTDALVVETETGIQNQKLSTYKMNL